MEDRFGFIQNEMDLKILILFILSRLPEPVSREELTDVTLLCDGAIGYFDFSECLADLQRTGHIRVEEGCYAVTGKGRENGEATASGLPYSVRVRAEKAASRLSEHLRRNALIKTSREMRVRGGFTVKLSLSDGVGPLISLELLAGDAKQSQAIEANFRKNAEELYLEIVALLTGKPGGD